MFDAILKRLLKLIPCDMGITFIIAAGVLSAGAAVVQARATHEVEQLRQRSLKNEMRQQGIAAEQQEIQRQQTLRYANSEAIVNAGNLDPYGSQSLVRLRAFNQEEAEKDVRTIKLNLGFAKANISNAILASKSRASGAVTAGYFGAGESLLGAAGSAAEFKALKEV